MFHVKVSQEAISVDESVVYMNDNLDPRKLFSKFLEF